MCVDGSVDKLADYEDELRRVKSARPPPDPHGLTSTSDTALAATTPTNAAEDIHRPATATAIRTSILPVQNRLSSFLSSTGRKSSPSPQLPNAPPTPTTSDLQAALSREQELRKQAEGELSQGSQELEELSAVLFQRANEMVAVERRARAKLEERIEMLERRDAEKRKRLAGLEEAIQRIERVRGMLGKQGS